MFFALCAAVAAERLLELAWSRRHLQGRRVAQEKIFPWMVLLHAATLVAAPLEARRRRPSPVALGALGAATLLRVWTLATMGDAWSVRVARPRAIITGGPYRWIRHPNYLAVIVELAALPLAGGAYLTAAMASLANALLLSRRIPVEEKLLSRDRRWRRHFGRLPRLMPWP
jgi:methyltransferase